MLLLADSGEVSITIETKVVVVNIPLLLGKDSIKAARMINFRVDKVTILDQIIQLIFTFSHHYVLPIAKIERDLKSNRGNVLLIDSQAILEL